jgi:hypothetical protein
MGALMKIPIQIAVVTYAIDRNAGDGQRPSGGGSDLAESKGNAGDHQHGDGNGFFHGGLPGDASSV